MAKQLRFGVIGCGVIAPCHIEGLQAQDDVAVTWVCDLMAEKAAKLAESYGVAHRCTDFRELLGAEDVDAICICTDHASHAPIAAAALDAGKHVLCEKALAANREGLDQMFAAHSRHPELTFGGVFQHRFDAEYRYLKELVESGQLGTVLTAGVQVRCLRTDAYYRADTWRGTWAHEGGAVLINQAIHFIDSLLWVMGGAKSLAGTYVNRTHADSMETEDTAVATLQFRQGGIGTIEATCSSHIGWEPTLAIHGTAGSIELRNGNPLKVVFTEEGKAEAVTARFAECLAETQVALGKSYYGTGHLPQLADFVEAVRSGRKPFVTAASARETVDVVLGIYEAHRNRCWVDL